MSDAPDLELAARWREGDRAAGDELVGRYYDQLRGYFVNAVGEKEHLDLLHDTFVRLTTALARFEATASFRTFLFVIARNTRIDYYRKHYKIAKNFDASHSSVEDVAGVTPSTAVTRLEEGRRLNACIRLLPIDDREMVELFYWHGWRATEIAELFGKPEATIRTRLRRARLSVRHCLGEQLEEVSRGDLVNELEQQLRELGCELGIPGGREVIDP
ncbi:RNA polymerase sigma factor [Pseudenhygromyxa sp. WMMC2535]|uniref:RNA polymerase sigma factor n=1 Tax=Pseudenhygromyxa sp. WMMC2535 TaxID=2712867 RepID=UPI0015571A9F|nr:RNA polymerase sigma factor [Pseudenhygromyxa sp. WMMC2535]NVB39820.1 RNA polymerase sigma factor [Pseudenhygromyxa sp. WMMC2535]